MKKTIKKLDKQVVQALTDACEQCKHDIPGFDWLTHTADYSNFPGSLVVRCVFDTDESLQVAEQTEKTALLVKRIHGALLKSGFLLKHPKKHVIFDTEEACAREHEGDWDRRIDYAH